LTGEGQGEGERSHDLSVSIMIRTYRTEDLDRVLDIWYQASLIAHPFLDAAFLAREREQIVAQYMPAAKSL